VSDSNSFIRASDFSGRSIIVTGGAGVLGGEISCALAEAGANVAILDREPEMAERWSDRLGGSRGRVMVEYCDVLDKEVVEKAVHKVLSEFGNVHCLVNGAGGNNPGATTSPELSFFDLPVDALRFVFDLNILGTIIPSQVVAKHMANQKNGVILNISSMNALRPLTRIPAYSAAKAGVSNFTQWLAVHLAQEYSPDIRVNAIAPGFFLTEQNRFLLTDRESGGLTPRGATILNHTPMGRFGNPEDLVGAVLWLLSPASSFVSGVVLPVDGGFQAFSGV
jgi:NAD(P)-dependent dehydrogenase (short-subunit alcohol dehydrogenase family)